MAELKVYGGEGYEIAHSVGSGLGFFGTGGFGYSIAIGAYNSKTYITNADGTSQGEEIDNLEYVDSTGCYYGGSGEYHTLTTVPNDKSTINLSFRHAESVDVQNAELRCYDGVNVDSAPSGIQFRAFEIIHPSSTYIDNGKGDDTWISMSGLSSKIELTDSPASGGTGAWDETPTADVQHDWFVGLTLSPTEIGPKQAKLYFNLEYL